jgi:hypothetical protein
MIHCGSIPGESIAGAGAEVNVPDLPEKMQLPVDAASSTLITSNRYKNKKRNRHIARETRERTRKKEIACYKFSTSSRV